MLINFMYCDRVKFTLLSLLVAKIREVTVGQVLSVM